MTSSLAFPNRAEIAAGQLANLRVLLRALVPANRFCSRKLEQAGVDPEVASLADFSTRFPFTTKSELVEDQKAHPPFGTNLTHPLETYTRFHQTSGTSGQPMRWLDTPESWHWLIENWAEVFRAAEVGPGDRVYFAFSFGPFLGFWMAFESAERLGCLCIPGGGLGSIARLRAIEANQATVLCCTPTYALRLGEVARQEGMDLGRSSVRVMVVAGEPGGSIPATRKLIETFWPRTRVFDHHGMTEVGPVTFECPRQPGTLHVIESGYLAEIVDPATGEPVSGGEAGELILTPLGRAASPLLRYRTGDLVQAGSRGCRPETPCVCGRYDLDLEGGILGRVDDMVIVRGVNVHPSAVEQIVRDVGGIHEYQVRLGGQGAMTEMTLVVERAPADSGDEAELKKRIAREFESTFSLRVPVEIAAPGSLPRFEMKARRWVKVQALEH